MPRLRIKGLVKVANTLRGELSGPLAPGRKDQLRELVVRSLREVDRIAAGHGVTPAALHEPSRRAYRFLQSLDFDAIARQPMVDADAAPAGNVSLMGINAYLDEMVAKLAKPTTAEQANELYGSIRSASERIETYLPSEQLAAKDLTPKSRSIRGWLAFFAERENFDAYLAAVRRARAAFESAIREGTRFSSPALVEFRPIHGIYQVRGHTDGTRVVLATPMICFADELFASVAQAAIHGGPKQAMVEAAGGEEYQGIQAELEALSGVEERTAGVHRDLEASFRRVAAAYFGQTLARPRLAWSLAFTGRKFGHYDPVRDTVMISCTLDRPDVPEFVLDSVMHHELLHKQLGVGWHDGRMRAHPAEFREQERRFVQYSEADGVLRRLAREA